MRMPDADTDTVWPGYVAAMACLLLGLLLVAAVLVVTTGQIGQLSESYQRAMLAIGFESGTQVERLARAAGLPDGAARAEASEPSGPSHAPGQARVDASQSRSLSGGRRDGQTDKKNPAPLDLANANFDREAARRAAQLASRDRALLAQIDLSKVDVRKIRFAGIDISKIDLSKQIAPTDLKKMDFSALQFGQISQSRVDVLKPFMAKEGIRYQLALQKQAIAPPPQPRQPTLAPQQPKQPNLAPPADVKAVPTSEPTPVIAAPKSQDIRLLFIEDALEPLPEQKQAIVKSLAAFNRPDSQWRLWVQVPTEDVYLKRIAYSRLMAVRAMALEAGFSPSRVSVAIESAPLAGLSLRDMSIHMTEVRP